MPLEKINCPDCGATILPGICKVDGILVRKWQGGETCSKCGFTVKSIADVERVANSFWGELCEELEKEQAANNDYVGLNASLREKSEEAFALLINTPLNEWSARQVSFYRAIVSFPQRQNYMNLFSSQDSNKDAKNKSVIDELQKIGSLAQKQIDVMERLVSAQKNTDDATGGIGLGIGVSIPLGDSSDD